MNATREQQRWGALEYALAGTTAVALFLVAGNFVMPRGRLLPTPILLAQIAAFSLMLMLHMVRHLGARLLVGFVVVEMSIAFLSDQVNFHTNGFVYGQLEYTSYLGPRIAGVPIGDTVPLALFTWPVMCLMSTLLYRRPIVTHEHRSWWESLAFSILCGVAFSWIAFATEPVCLHVGAYRYTNVLNGTEAGVWYGAPERVWWGWTATAATMTLAFIRFIGPKLGTLRNPSPHPFLDSVPFAHVLITAAGLASLAVDKAAALVTLYTGGAYGLMATFVFAQTLRPGKRQDPAVVSDDA